MNRQLLPNLQEGLVFGPSCFGAPPRLPVPLLFWFWLVVLGLYPELGRLGLAWALFPWIPPRLRLVETLCISSWLQLFLWSSPIFAPQANPSFFFLKYEIAYGYNLGQFSKCHMCMVSRPSDILRPFTFCMNLSGNTSPFSSDLKRLSSIFLSTLTR